MELIIGVASGVIIFLVVLLYSLRRKPFYSSLWIMLWGSLLASSVLSFCIGTILWFKRNTNHSIGPSPMAPSLTDFLCILLVVIASYLFICAIAVFCVVPPRGKERGHYPPGR